MTSSAVIFGWRPTARACNSSWSSNIARAYWAFILLLPLLLLVIPSLSLQYEVSMSLVKFESTSVWKVNAPGRRLVSVLGRAAAASNRPECQAGPGQEEQATQQNRPNGEGQEQGVVEIVLGEAEEGHQQDRDHAERRPAQERAPLDVGCPRQAGAIRRRHQPGSDAKDNQRQQHQARGDGEDHGDHDDGGNLAPRQPPEQVHPVEREPHRAEFYPEGGGRVSSGLDASAVWTIFASCAW